MQRVHRQRQLQYLPPSLHPHATVLSPLLLQQLLEVTGVQGCLSPYKESCRRCRMLRCTPGKHRRMQR